MFSQSVTRNVGHAVGEKAWRCARKHATQLIGTAAPLEWSLGICMKSASICLKELLPLSRERLDKSAAEAISEILGICYLGDYALEASLAFNVPLAREMVHARATLVGVPENETEMLLDRMVDFYHTELSTGVNSGCSCVPPTRRYLLKSADVCLLQRIIVAPYGKLESAVERGLDAASAALDVLDDAMDLGEDAVHRTGNPLVAARDDMFALRDMFAGCVSPYLVEMRNAVSTEALPRAIANYIVETGVRIQRLSQALGTTA